MEITVDQAIQNLDRACALVAGTRQDHINLQKSLELLAGLAKKDVTPAPQAPAEPVTQ